MKVTTETNIHGVPEEPPVGSTVLFDDAPGVIAARRYGINWKSTGVLTTWGSWEDLLRLHKRIVAILLPEESEPIRTYPNEVPRVLRKSELKSVAEYNGASEPVVDLDKANIITSASPVGDQHYPVLDLDVPAHLIPSSTPGHSHLYIDHPVSQIQLWDICEAMADAGILEQGYFKASRKRGYTAVRLPWIKKEKAA